MLLQLVTQACALKTALQQTTHAAPLAPLWLQPCSACLHANSSADGGCASVCPSARLMEAGLPQHWLTGPRVQDFMYLAFAAQDLFGEDQVGLPDMA